MISKRLAHYSTGAHGATDVTGFGILGHVRNLARSQKASVCFKIHTLPSKIKTVYLIIPTTVMM